MFSLRNISGVQSSNTVSCMVEEKMMSQSKQVSHEAVREEMKKKKKTKKNRGRRTAVVEQAENQ